MNRRLFLGMWFCRLAVSDSAYSAWRVTCSSGPTSRCELLALLWLATAVAMVLIARFLFNWRKLARVQRFEAAALLVIGPGMALDAFVAHMARCSSVTSSPICRQMPLAASATWLLLAYASVLLAAAFLPLEPN